MSAQDERKAAIYLARRRHYNIDGLPKPRRRYRGPLAAIGVIGFALVCLLARCSYGGTIKISFSGTLESWQGKAVYDAQIEGDLESPTPFEMEIYVDENAADLDSSTTRGVYTSAASHIIFRFGPFEETHWGAVIEVLSGHPQPGGGHLWGYFFRNLGQCSAFGVYRPALVGIYAFYVTAFSAYGPSIVPNDSLSNIFAGQNNFYFNANKHAYHRGLAGYPPIDVRSEADNDLSAYSAEVVE